VTATPTVRSVSTRWHGIRYQAAKYAARVASNMNSRRLERELDAAFGGTDAERRAVARAARDLVDAGRLERDRGHALTVPDVIRNLEDAPAGSDLVDRWNWWMGALGVAYGGYDRFAVRFVDGDEPAGLRR
jgi:hypothetical protein